MDKQWLGWLERNFLTAVFFGDWQRAVDISLGRVPQEYAQLTNLVQWVLLELSGHPEPAEQLKSEALANSATVLNETVHHDRVLAHAAIVREQRGLAAAAMERVEAAHQGVENRAPLLHALRAKERIILDKDFHGPDTITQIEHADARLAGQRDGPWGQDNSLLLLIAYRMNGYATESLRACVDQLRGQCTVWRSMAVALAPIRPESALGFWFGNLRGDIPTHTILQRLP